jgi:hypothetical protein
MSISLRRRGVRVCPGTEKPPEAEKLPWADVALPVTTVDSAMVFHCPHEGHRPSHFGLSYPQFLQNHVVFVLFDAAAIRFSYFSVNLANFCYL